MLFCYIVRALTAAYDLIRDVETEKWHKFIHARRNLTSTQGRGRNVTDSRNAFYFDANSNRPKEPQEGAPVQVSLGTVVENLAMQQEAGIITGSNGYLVSRSRIPWLLIPVGISLCVIPPGRTRTGAH